MISLLAKWFIHDRENVKSPSVRTAYGVLCGAVGIGWNILLFLGKLIAGTMTASIAVTADAFNNLSDAGSSIITLIGFRISGLKADLEHPFGHGRVEYVSGLIVSMAIVVMGFQLLITSVNKIFAPEPVEFSWLAMGILVASILVKCYMALYNRAIAKKINSSAMKATATDSLSDTITTSVVLLSMLIGKWTGLAVDGYAGVLVALFILYAGFNAARDTISPLLGQPPQKEFVDEIDAIVEKHPEIIGVHDLLVHDYGPGRVMVSLHAEVDAQGNMLELHDTIDNIERELRETLGCHAVIHMDPVMTRDEATAQYSRMVREIVARLDPALTIHDFRIVKGPTHTNLIFDVVVPFGFRMTDEEVAAAIKSSIAGLEGNFFAVVEIDKAYA